MTKRRYVFVGHWGDWYVWLALIPEGFELVKRRVDKFWSRN